VLMGIVAVGLALAAVGFVVWGNSTRPRSVSHGPPAGTARKSRSHPTPPPGAGTTQDEKASPPKAIHVILTAARSDSWVEIRRGSSTGRVLFAGVVSEGKSIRVVGRRFWARFGAIGNFDLTVNGRPVHPTFNGTVDALITAAAIRQAQTETRSG
jgi:Domain of unknown function (DUF4115)